MGACGSKSAKKNFAGDGHTLQPKQQQPQATTEKTVNNNDYAVNSPGYRLSGGGGATDPEKAIASPGAPSTTAAAAQAQPQSPTTDDIERQKRLEAIEKRADKLAGKQVKPRAFADRA